MSRFIGELGLLALLAGCAGTTPVPPGVAATGMPNSELALQKSMANVHAALAELGGITASQAAPDPPIVAAELDRPVSLTWNGPLDDGVKSLADRIGYQTTVTGPQTTKPLPVSINLSNVTALAAFQALGGAAGTAATVVVDPQHHRVEVDHHV